MLIQWLEKDEWGNETVRKHPLLNTNNIGSYAKKTCITCWGKGFNEYDNGFYYIYEVNEPYDDMIRKPINPRTIACDCVIRRIERLGGLQ